MFTHYFGLKFNPFSKEIQPEQLFLSQDLIELESRLKYLQQVRGIGLVAGEPGCGKTAALRKFVSELNPAAFKPCYFALSTVTLLDFYQGLARLLGEEPKHKKMAIFYQLQEVINSMYHERRITPVIILDEIHLANSKIFDDLRLLFNFKMDSHNPYILILAGQPVLRSKLSLNANQPLKQRLTVKYFMQGLKPDEVKEYCLSRLKMAGLVEDIFAPNTFELIYNITGGLPRVINNLVTACMIYACSKKIRIIDEDVVYHAHREMEI